LSCDSSSTTSPPPRVRVPRHVAWLVTRLVVDYFASRRLVVDYFAYTARPSTSACRMARHAAHRAARRRLPRLAQARRQLLHLHHAYGCLGTSRDSSCDSSLTTSPRAGSLSTTSPKSRVRVPRHVTRLVIDYFASRRLVVDYFALRRLVVDYFAYATRPSASARRSARHAARHRLLCLAQARRRVLHLHRASGCFGTSRDLLCDSSSTTSPRTGSSSTTSPTPRVRVPQHVARLVTWLVVDYFASRRLVVNYFTYAVRPVASAHCATCCVTRRRLLRLAQALR
jgi:hypothetical protein